jgi:hypothetical protein
MVIDLNYTSLNIYMDEPIQKKKRTRGKRRRRPGWDGDNANKATEKQTAKKDTDKLAKAVFSAQQEGEEKIEIVPEPKKTKKTKFMPIPVRKDLGETEEEDDRNPVILTQGTHASNAFIIQKHLLREMHSILNQHFGREDMDYFIHSENTSTMTRWPSFRKKYKIVLIEDKNGFKYNIWFDLTALGPFSY